MKDIAAAAKINAAPPDFVMGTNDLAKETGARFLPGRAPIMPWLATCILAARACGIDILDGVYKDLQNAAVSLPNANRGAISASMARR